MVPSNERFSELLLVVPRERVIDDHQEALVGAQSLEHRARAGVRHDHPRGCYVRTGVRFQAVRGEIRGKYKGIGKGATVWRRTAAVLYQYAP